MSRIVTGTTPPDRRSNVGPHKLARVSAARRPTTAEASA